MKFLHQYTYFTFSLLYLCSVIKLINILKRRCINLKNMLFDSVFLYLHSHVIKLINILNTECINLKIYIST